MTSLWGGVEGEALLISGNTGRALGGPRFLRDQPHEVCTFVKTQSVTVEQRRRHYAHHHAPGLLETC